MPITNKAVEKSMITSKQSLESILTQADVMAAILPFGYTPARIQDLLTKRDSTNDTYLDLLSKRDDQIETSLLIDKQFEKVSRKFGVFMSGMKIYFNDSPSIIRGLGLEGRVKRSLPALIVQSTNSYSKLLKKQSVLDQLVAHEITAVTIQADLDEITALEALHSQHKFLMGNCQRLTEDRDRMHKELKGLLKLLKKVLYMVYPKGQRQILEQHNIFVRNQAKKTTDGIPTEPPTEEEPPAEEPVVTA